MSALFIGSGPGEPHCRLNPSFQGLIGVCADGADVDHRLHRLASEVHWSSMRLVQCCGSVFRREPQHEIGFQNATTHVAVHHERKSSEHHPFGKFAGALQDRPNAVCEMDIVRHDY